MMQALRGNIDKEKCKVRPALEREAVILVLTQLGELCERVCLDTSLADKDE